MARGNAPERLGMRETSPSSDVLILGGGIGGMLLAALLSGKRKVTVLEKEDVPAKRIKVSGNGRCNFFNENLLRRERYDGESFLSPLRRFFFPVGKDYPARTLEFLRSGLGIASFREGDLYYPFFNRSECVYDPMKAFFDRSGALLLHGLVTQVDVARKTVHYLEGGERKAQTYGELVLATGGVSYDRTEEDALYLERLPVSFTTFRPALCPVRTVERIPPSFVGQRLRGRVTLLSGDKALATEDGEVLFKKDGLSGIAIFNLTVPLHKERREKGKGPFRFVVDYRAHDGFDGGSCSLESFPSFLRGFVSKKGKPFAPLVFTFQDFYPFASSQVSDGGLRVADFDDRLASRRDSSLHALGEVLDVSLPCGGYNIGSTLIEALVLADALGGL